MLWFVGKSISPVLADTVAVAEESEILSLTLLETEE